MSHTSRRSFLSTAGALIAAAAAAPLEAVRPPRADDAPAPTGPGRGPVSTPAASWITNQPQIQTVALYQFTPELFQPLVGTNFQAVDDKGRRLVLRLRSVSDLSKQCNGSQTAFSLQFQMVSGKQLPQGTYQFSTPPLGTFLLFVVPSKPSKTGTYTAVINRL